MENETIIPPHRELSLLQMWGIVLVANTAIRMLANRPPAPQIVRNVVNTVVESTTDSQ
jgi:hypothetical protein